MTTSCAIGSPENYAERFLHANATRSKPAKGFCAFVEQRNEGETQMNPIPEGYHSVTPHLIIRDAARALDFYRDALGAEELFRLPGPDGKLMHASIRIGDSIVMMNDEMEGQSGPTNGSPVILHIYTPDADALFERAVGAGANGGHADR
jgi:predicted enzyme related to lactoylglutathione lyase